MYDAAAVVEGDSLESSSISISSTTNNNTAADAFWNSLDIQIPAGSDDSEIFAVPLTKEQKIWNRVDIELAKYEAEAAQGLSMNPKSLLRYWQVCAFTRCRPAAGADPFQDRETIFPLLFKVAMSYLPPPASAVSSERVFSAVRRTITDFRNRLDGEHVEMNQILKFYFKNDDLIFKHGKND